MRLTRDIFTDVVQLLDTPTLTSACLVASEFYELAARVLYGNVVIRRRADLLLFHRTLADMPKLRAYVWAFQYYLPRGGSPYHTLQILRWLSRATHIDLGFDVPLFDWIHILSQAWKDLPRMTSLRLRGVSPSLTASLRSHPVALQSFCLYDSRLDGVDTWPEEFLSGVVLLLSRCSSILRVLRINSRFLLAHIHSDPSALFPSLRTLQFTPCSKDMLSVDFIRATPHLRDIALGQCPFPFGLLADCRFWIHLENVHYYLRHTVSPSAVLPSLKQLSVASVHHNPRDLFLSELDMFPCVNITTLILASVPSDWLYQRTLATRFTRLQHLLCYVLESGPDDKHKLAGSIISPDLIFPASLKTLALRWSEWDDDISFQYLAESPHLPPCLGFLSLADKHWAICNATLTGERPTLSVEDADRRLGSIFGPYLDR